MFTAGGFAAGKSTVADDALVAQSDLVFDGTMRDSKQAIKTIEQALAKGWDVRIHYIQRPIGLVVSGAMERANQMGRWLNIAELPKVHAESQRSIVEIAHHFADDPRVRISYWLNDGESKETPPQMLTLKEVETGGRASLANDGFIASGRQVVKDAFQKAVNDGKYDRELLLRLAKGDKELSAMLKVKVQK